MYNSICFLRLPPSSTWYIAFFLRIIVSFTAPEFLACCPHFLPLLKVVLHTSAILNLNLKLTILLCLTWHLKHNHCMKTAAILCHGSSLFSHTHAHTDLVNMTQSLVTQFLLTLWCNNSIQTTHPLSKMVPNNFEKFLIIPFLSLTIVWSSDAAVSVFQKWYKFINLAASRRPVQGVPCLSPNDGWDRLQPPRDPTVRLSGYRKWMDGCLQVS